MRNKNQGFTIIELMIATAVFATILLIASTIVIQVGRMYYKGVIVVKTQDTTRGITDEISRSLQFTNLPITGPVASAAFGTPQNAEISSYCIGNTRYTWAKNGQVSDTVSAGEYSTGNHRIRHGLWRDTKSGEACAPLDLTQEFPPLSSANGKELLPENTRLVDFSITPVGNNFYSVRVSLLYGDDDLIETGITPPTCLGGATGAEWCATSVISTQVLRRVAN